MFNDELTCSTLFHFFCGSRKDVQDLNYYLHHHVCHCRSWCDPGINLKSSKEIFDTLEDIDKEVLACIDILSRLGTPDVTRAHTQGINEQDTNQEEDTNASKNHFGGRESLPIGISARSLTDQLILAKPTPSPSVAENAYKTLMVGFSHFRSLSSLLRDRLNWSTWS